MLVVPRLKLKRLDVGPRGALPYTQDEAMKLATDVVILAQDGAKVLLSKHIIHEN